ncbi:MAG: insulinase family protein [Novosphingobium sp.]
MRHSFLVFALLVLLSACAPQASRVNSAAASAAWRADTSWAFETSDVPLDPGYRLGRLANGMRYAVRANKFPQGTAVVRMEVAAGSLDEAPGERGFAHFVEHMAFNGSTHVPEGEMIRLLARNGLAFGPDANASTGFEQTTYLLDLPRNSPKLLDTALMLMRETASELSFTPEAVAGERGVVLAEMRDRNGWQLRNAMDDARFFHPQAVYPQRFPIGAAETVRSTSPEGLKAFWRREYVPAHATIIVIGDFDPALMEAKIRDQFANWEPAAVAPQPDGGPVRIEDRARTEVYIDPALSERVIAARHGAWLDEPDTRAQRRENLLRQIGYGVVNRRLQRISRQPNPPFRGAGFGSGKVFTAGRTTRLVVDTVDGTWRRGIDAAARAYRHSLKSGFTPGEIAEQVANIRAAAEDAAASADTRSNRALANGVFALLRDRLVPSDPRDALARLNAFIPEITPERVLAALKREAVPIKTPLIRFQGRRLPVGGEKALAAAWRHALHEVPGQQAQAASSSFGYHDFGASGGLVADGVGPLGIREVRFANGIMLNVRRTDIEKDRILVQISIDGGDKLATKTDPLATELFGTLPAGGLGKHSQDELQSILAGHTLGTDLASGEDRFILSGRTTARDLEEQLDLLAAFVTDPGYRPEGEVQYRLQINNFYASKDATPQSALQTAIGGILSDNDPRFSLQPIQAYRGLSFARLREAIADRLAQGAIEIGIVGDIDEAEAIRLVGRSFGALPTREPAFRSYAEQPPRAFTGKRGRRILRHGGPEDQALLRLTWPTRDDADPIETLRLELLEKVVRIELTETLREKLGEAYSPTAASAPSRSWRGYGTFAITATVDVDEVSAARAAIVATLRELRSRPIDSDLLQRARQPMIGAFDNGLKSNFGWMTLVDRAQTERDRIDRYLRGKAWLEAMTPADIQAMALRYLDPGGAVEVLVLPASSAKAEP